ncbi:DUF3265 domain-containing protein [Vibrio cholerae]|nr:DUF3265 domain-containing protein [Vibrio cholerae]EGQ9395987.1 DUF3265 domain-containing protein [Vibrio cholerae]EGR0487655.1 DUF3265 domain-containing protein [Vibrio cholerae]EGR2439048.1 DUF3265 domain-containing protein [Vibrio cholerae]EGR2520263.1 DUF3265 domain-containing protein [Vibrio cholerae]EGR2590925.1 DUF3265 domain-containing protein [Vibrio cholerae]
MSTNITKHLRGTHNAWHFGHAFVFVMNVLCIKCFCALFAP